MDLNLHGRAFKQSYHLSKDERLAFLEKEKTELKDSIYLGNYTRVAEFFYYEDIVIRNHAYEGLSKVFSKFPQDRENITALMFYLMRDSNPKIRQNTVKAAGEIGRVEFKYINNILKRGLFDVDNSVLNATINSVQKLVQTNPVPTLKFTKKYLYSHLAKVRVQLLFAIEMRGRTNPQDILTLLKELQDDDNEKVQETVVLVIGRISILAGNLETIVLNMKSWHNDKLVSRIMFEVLKTHKESSEAVRTFDEAKDYVEKNFTFDWLSVVQ